jgi:MoaA/NifB/PqqE/SkfB family radical SAM enzyme
VVQAIEIGFACDNACTFCAQGRLRSVAPLHARERVLERIAAIDPRRPVAFVGGEPTLAEDLPALVRLARARGSGVLVQTNGRRLAIRGFAQELAAAGVTALDVSLHGATEAMHDYHTGTAGSFRQTVAGLGRARAARLAVGITTVVTRSNFRHLAEIVRVAHTLGARAVQLAAVTPAGNAILNAPRLMAPAPLVRPHLARAIELASRLELDWLAGERCSRPEVRDWFAGLGNVEPEESIELDSGATPSLNVVLRGRAELHPAGIG